MLRKWSVYAVGLFLLFSCTTVDAQAWAFRRGNCAVDDALDVTDPVVALEYLFLGGDLLCFDACDSNDDGMVDVSDVVYLLEYLFILGPPPPAPFPDCGVDPTDDALLDCTGPLPDCGLLSAAPMITSTPGLDAVEGELYFYDVDATDPDLPADTLTYSLVTSPAGAGIDPLSGAVSWTPTLDQAGDHLFVARVTDSAGLSDEQFFTVVVANTNQPPTIVSPPVTTATEGEPYTYAVVVDDPDVAVGDVLSFTLLAAPTGATITADVGVITWTPTPAQVGGHLFIVLVEDAAGLFAVQRFTVDVANANQMPTITTTPVSSGAEGDLYFYDVDATDPDLAFGDLLTFSLTVAPIGATIEATSGALSWTPTLEQAGDHDITVRVTDTAGLFDEQSFSINVSNTNQAPAITSLPVTVGTEAVPYQYDVDATDLDLAQGDSLTFGLNVAPVGASIDAATGLIEWTPTLQQAGSHPFVVRVTDAVGLAATQSFAVMVADANQPPTITSAAITTATEGALYFYDVDADDVDLATGDTLTFSLVVAPVGAAIDGDSGVVTWTPAFDQAGDHPVTIEVADQLGLTDQQLFTITVANSNQAPTITSSPILGATESELYSYDVDAVDPDLAQGDTLTFSLIVAPTGASIDAAAGVVTWTPTESQIGSHPFLVRVEDLAGLADSQSFTVTVGFMNESPVITSTPVTDATEDELYFYDVDASDPDEPFGDMVMFSLENGPTEAMIDAMSGVLTWTPTLDDAGDYPVVVRATDNSGLFDEQSFTLTVANTNQPPSIDSARTTDATEGSLYTYQVEASDPDSDQGDSLSYSLPTAPTGASIDGAGLLSWTPATDQPGDHPFIVRVTDSGMLFVEQPFTVTVANTNQVPAFVSAPIVSASVGESYTYDADAVDPDLPFGDALAFALDVAPVGMSIDPPSGLIQWIPEVGQIGDHPVTVRVEDVAGLFDLQSFTVTVALANEAPTAVADSYSVGVGCTIDVSLLDGVLANDTDPEDDPLTAMVVTPPVNGVLVLQSDGSFSYTHDGGAALTNSFEYEASDGISIATATVSLTVVDDPFGFFDHFDGATVDPTRWTATEVSGGSAALTDSFVDFDSPAEAAASFLASATPIDPTVSQTWWFCVRRVSGGNVPDLVGLWGLPAGSTPQAESSAVLDSQRVAGISMVDAGPEATIRFRYDPAADGLGRHWRGEPGNLWTSPGVEEEAVPSIRQGLPGDWYVVGFEIDADTASVRFFSQHQQEAAIDGPVQGVRMVALTDWVPFTDFGGLAPGDDLWLTVGDRHVDTYAGEYHLEWVRHQCGAALDGYTNVRPTVTSEYVLRHLRARGTQFMPDGRGDNILIGGAAGTWNDLGNRKKSVVRDDDGTLYLFYEGFDSSSESSIGLATSSAVGVPFAPDPSNPIIERSILPGGDAMYDVLTAPFVIKDNGETDAAKRWKMLVAGEVRNTSIHRMFLLTAPAPTGPWALEPGPGLDSSVIDESMAGDWRDDGASDPLVWWDADASLWRMYYSGNREKETDFGVGGWSVGLASSPDLIDWTDDPGNPVITGDGSRLRGWTAANGRTITLSDASGFEEEALVVIRNNTTTDGWGLSRIRRINGNDLELYHEIGGVSGTSSNRTVAMLSAGSISPMSLVREPHGCYRLYVTVFQPFVLGFAGAGFGNCELVSALTAPTPFGPWEWDYQGEPHAPPTIWGANRNQENLRVIRGPVDR